MTGRAMSREDVERKIEMADDASEVEFWGDLVDGIGDGEAIVPSSGIRIVEVGPDGKFEDWEE